MPEQYSNPLKNQMQDKRGEMMGHISGNSKKGGYFMPEGKTDRKDEIFIDSDKLGTALNGDEVLVQNERVVRGPLSAVCV